MIRPETAGSPEATAFHAALTEVTPELAPESLSWVREIAKDTFKPPEWERFLLYHPHFQNNWGDMLRERAAHELPRPTVSGLVSLWQHAQDVTAALHRGKSNNLPARQLFARSRIEQVNWGIRAYNQEQPPQLLAPFIVLQTAAKSLRADGLDVDTGIRDACSNILENETAAGRRDKRALTFANAMVTFAEFYFSERDSEDNAILEPIYQMKDSFGGDANKFIPWLKKVSGVTEGTMAVKLTKELAVMLGDSESTFTYTQIEELMSRQPLGERARAVDERRAAAAEHREAEAATLRDWEALSERLSLNPRNATANLIHSDESDTAEGAAITRHRSAESGEAASKDPFRAATLLHLKELTGGEIFFRLRGEAELRAEGDSGPVKLDDTTGYLFLVTPEGHVIAEDPHRRRATLIMRTESVQVPEAQAGSGIWRQVFHGTHKEILERGVVRARHPDAEEIAQDYDGTLQKYVSLLMEDLVRPLESGERLRDPWRLQTISALGALAVR